MKFNKVIAAAIIVSLSVFGCNSDEESNGNRSFGSSVIPAVEAVQAEFGSLPLEERLSGIVRAGNQVEIFPRINAPIEEVYVQNGDVVAQGDPLVRLEDREFRERLQQARANLRINEARARQAEARLNEVRNQYNRQQSLAERDLISEVELEAIEAQLQSAEADYELALAQVDQAKSSTTEQEGQLDRTIIRAPINGTIGQRNAEIGMQVNNNSRLFVIGNLNETKVLISLTEQMLRYIQPGQTAGVYSETLGDTLLYGEVSRISPYLEAGSFSTEAEIDLPNTDGLLLPGMFVSVDVLYGESDQAVIVPLSAIYRHPRTGEQGVFVASSFGLETEPITDVDSNNPPPLSEPTDIEFRSVQVVAKGREAAGIVGINSGEWVVTVGQSLLIGASENNRARVRAVSWDRILTMQRMQPQDLLRNVMREELVNRIGI